MKIRPRLLVTALLGASLLTALAAADSAPAPAIAGNAAAPAAHARIDVTIDPRIELVAITQHLSGYVHRSRQTRGRINDFDHPYLNALRQQFAPFKDHDSIKQLASLGVGGSAPIDIAVNLTSPNDVVLRGTLDWEAAHLPKAALYVDALRAFAQAANFMAFFAAHQASHQAIIDGFKQTVDLPTIAAQLEAYCGTKPDRYVVVLAPLMGRTWFGPSAVAPDGAKVTYAIITPGNVVDGELVFGTRARLGEYLSHEFGHSFVNPLVDKHWDELAKHSALMEQVHYAEGQNYGRGWKTCLYEHIDRAVVARVVMRESGTEAYARQLADDKKRGFLFVEDLCRALETYEQSRDTYPSLDSFFPELARVFASQHEPGKPLPSSS